MTQENTFTFYDPGPLIDDDLELVLVECYPGDMERGYVPTYKYEMQIQDTGIPVGRVELRVGKTDHLVNYAGQIGYEVNPEHRGHHYAARSCRLLFSIARHHDLNPIWITCNPDNQASRRTCEIIGGELVEIVPVPVKSSIYRRGDRQKCRYRVTV